MLIEFGPKNNDLIDRQGEYWRFINPIFIHIGFLYFLLNNYLLWILGREVERLYGSARFAVISIWRPDSEGPSQVIRATYWASGAEQRAASLWE